MVERFWVVVRDEMVRMNLGLARGCEDHLRMMIDRGVDALWNDEARPDQVDDALDNLRRFVRVMGDDAKAKEYGDLHEDTYHAARLKLCPGCWPFC